MKRIFILLFIILSISSGLIFLYKTDSDKYYYENEIAGYKYLGKKIISARQRCLESNFNAFNSNISKFLIRNGAFDKVSTLSGDIDIPANMAYQNWKSVFDLNSAGFIKFTKYIKVRYKVDHLTKKRFIESSKLYIEAEQYLYDMPYSKEAYYRGTEIWSAQIK